MTACERHRLKGGDGSAPWDANKGMRYENEYIMTFGRSIKGELAKNILTG
jgi:hypothetical protein